MCGRYALWEEESEMLRNFEVETLLGHYLPTWNAAPGQNLPVILERAHDNGTRRRAQTLKWGLVANWNTTPRPVINARSETLLSKPSFAQSARYRRCLVPVNGYYEWTKEKQPYFFSEKGDTLFALAGIYDAWQAPQTGGETSSGWLRTFAIVTRTAPPALAPIHHRAPVTVPRPQWNQWLSPQLTDPLAVNDLLVSIPAPQLQLRAANRRVGTVTNNDPQLLTRENKDRQTRPPLLK